jgi:hypothetical protein
MRSPSDPFIFRSPNVDKIQTLELIIYNEFWHKSKKNEGVS